MPIAQPAEVGLDAERLQQIEGLVLPAIEEGKMPGCVICVGKQGKIAYLKAFGNRQVQPSVEAMKTDTVFDLASLTKPVATATAVMCLLEQGKLKLEDLVVDHFPQFASHGKDKITILHLLTHQSGLIPDNALADYLAGPEVAWQRICDLHLTAPVGEVFKYSDVNFIVLGKLVEKLSGQTLDQFTNDHLFQPLGMLETGFNPPAELAVRAAVTEQRGGQWMQGEVHDPRAFALGGVAGHAGLFSTAQDLAVYAQMMLGMGTLNRKSETDSGDETVTILAPQTLNLMTKKYTVSSGIRGLGWDKQTGFSSNKGTKLSDAAFGHGGFTGTVIWIDPHLDLFFVFLSNRVHPNGQGSVNRLAGDIVDVIVDAFQDSSDDSTGRTVGVRLGVDVLRQDGFSLLAGKRVGLITNHTGRTSDGMSTVKLLSEAKDVKLTALFSPEHGFKGELDVAKISDAQDQSTGLTIYSLYGETRRPSKEMLADVDVLVFDIQDVGTRFYTYVSTMGEAMRAAAAAGKSFVVLDRPNPINGIELAGPMLDRGKESFVGYHHLPVRHAMTTGELAMLLNAELSLGLELHVVRCEGWKREHMWDATNLLWVNPSPNMRSLTQALLYPGIGLLEMTNLSVGRGTDTPFEVIGAPWIDARKLAAALNQQGLPGVTFVPIEFTPVSSKFAQQLCGGVNIVITDRNLFQPVKTGLCVASLLHSLYPDAWETKNYDRLLGSEVVWKGVVDGMSLDKLTELASTGLDEFIKRREKFLLY